MLHEITIKISEDQIELLDELSTDLETCLDENAELIHYHKQHALFTLVEQLRDAQGASIPEEEDDQS